VLREAPDNAARRGIAVDIWAQSLAGLGLGLIPVHGGWADLAAQLADGIIDAISDPPPDIPGLHYLDDVVRLADRIVVDRHGPTAANSITDLAGRRVVAFSNAAAWLETVAGGRLPAFADYREIADPVSLAAWLFDRRADAIVIDGAVFDLQLRRAGEDPAEFRIRTPVARPSYTGAGFRNPILRATFLESLVQLKQSDLYDAIYRRYPGAVARR
jgi:ABC-type amino acid transport substrate-binding protein